MMNISEKFLFEIEEFLSKAGMRPTVFGKDALGDPGFVFGLRKGRSPSLKTMDRVQSFMLKHTQDEDAA